MAQIYSIWQIISWLQTIKSAYGRVQVYGWNHHGVTNKKTRWWSGAYKLLTIQAQIFSSCHQTLVNHTSMNLTSCSVKIFQRIRVIKAYHVAKEITRTTLWSHQTASYHCSLLPTSLNTYYSRWWRHVNMSSPYENILDYQKSYAIGDGASEVIRWQTATDIMVWSNRIDHSRIHPVN